MRNRHDADSTDQDGAEEQDEQDLLDEYDDAPRTQRMRRQDDRSGTSRPPKNQDRRQREKEWGRAIFKFHKDRKRNGGKE
ncbi:MAG TPA: hypothetical protein VFS21_17490 [Roseiflexaceae bacterium]|nr:hypothetical protein [Roseiflexaceae bacterium]